MRDRRRGMTMIEMLFVLIVIGGLTSIATPKVTMFVNDARVARATGDIRAIQVDIMKYIGEHDTPPPGLAAIQRTGTLDPWGQPYIYVAPGGSRVDAFGVPLNQVFDLYSVGENGTTSASIMTGASQDDIVLGNDGGFIGQASRY